MVREDNQGGVVFQEVQQFRQWWMRLPLLFLVVIFWGMMAVGVIWWIAPGMLPGTPDRGELVSILVIWAICWLLFGIGLPLVINSVKLIVEVGSNGVSLRYSVFASRFIRFEDIRACETRHFSPIRDYGGVGVKWAPGKGRAYIIDGNQGVWFELTSGEKLLIGSQRPDDLLGAIKATGQRPKARS